jgi:hypothetical protein
MSNIGTMVVIGTTGTAVISPIERADVGRRAHDALDGYLELVPRFVRYQGHACVAFCDEDGKRKGLPPNAIATELWRLQVAVRNFSDFLVGPVVIVYGPPEFMKAL